LLRLLSLSEKKEAGELFAETLPAKDRPALRRVEWNGRFASARSTFNLDRNLLSLTVRRCDCRFYPIIFCLFARFATLWRICQSLLMKKSAFAGRPNELLVAVETDDRHIR